MGKEKKMKRLTPLKAIRAKCMECSNMKYKEVELCPCDDCPLYAYRFGRRTDKPYRVTRAEKKNKTAPSPT
jgi:hypothetical protein